MPLNWKGISNNNFVYPADFVEAQKAIKLQLKSRDTDPDKSLFLNYRVKAKSGKILHLSTLGRYVEDSYYGDVFVIFVLPDDLSMKRKKIKWWSSRMSFTIFGMCNFGPLFMKIDGKAGQKDQQELQEVQPEKARA